MGSRAALIIVLAALGPPVPAAACPELIVPLDPRAPALRAEAWRGPLAAWRQGRWGAALRGLRATSGRLEREAERLFRPKKGRKVRNADIQRWLRRNVTSRPPSVVIRSERFDYPALVWWAWADTACRAGHVAEARVAARRLADQGDRGVRHHLDALLALRAGRTEDAALALRSAPPDRFLTPYAEGLLALARGQREAARRHLDTARAAADLPARRAAVEKALGRLR